MAEIMPVQSLLAETPAMGINSPAQPLTSPGGPMAAGFSSFLVNGVEAVDQNLMQADALARAFVLDDSIPVHQVTFAMEQAKMSFELMLQIRDNLLDSYRQLMNMQI